MKVIIAAMVLIAFVGCCERSSGPVSAGILRFDMQMPDDSGVLKRIRHEVRIFRVSDSIYYQFPSVHAVARAGSVAMTLSYEQGRCFSHKSGDSIGKWKGTGSDSSSMRVDSFKLLNGLNLHLDPNSSDSLVKELTTRDGVILSYHHKGKLAVGDPFQTIYFLSRKPVATHGVALCAQLEKQRGLSVAKVICRYGVPTPREYRFELKDTMLADPLSALSTGRNNQGKESRAHTH